uniref:Uncharacterized protein n=1 Tax=Arundo donax TaxID=35708 RepID=A0A0A9HEZ5_ARUDO
MLFICLDSMFSTVMFCHCYLSDKELVSSLNCFIV